MGDQDYQSTCLSAEPHDLAIRDHVQHFFGCLEFQERRNFFSPQNPIWKQDTKFIIENEAANATPNQRWDTFQACLEQLRKIEYLREAVAQDDENGLIPNVTQSKSAWKVSSSYQTGLAAIRKWKEAPEYQRKKNSTSSWGGLSDSQGHIATAAELEKLSLKFFPGMERGLKNLNTNDIRPARSATDILVTNDSNNEASDNITLGNCDDVGETPRNYDPKNDLHAYMVQFEADNNYYYHGTEQRAANVRSIEGHFPDQRMSVAALLGETRKVEDGTIEVKYEAPDENFLRDDRKEGHDTIRWFHLPANDVAWAERAIALYYGEHVPNRTLEGSQNTSSYMILPLQYWRSQLHGGRNDGIHAWNMQPFSEVVSSNPDKVEGNAKSAPNDIVLFMPYLNREVYRNQTAFSKLNDKFTSQDVQRNFHNRLKKQTHLSPADIQKSIKAPKDTRWANKQVEDTSLRARSGFFQTAGMSLLNRFGWAGEKTHKRQMLTKRLEALGIIQPSATTIQSEVSGIKNPKMEVVNHRVISKSPLGQYLVDAARLYRAMSNYDDENFVRVDQLWMWILDTKTIITLFPERGGANRDGRPGVHKSIRARLNNLQEHQIRSVFDLALIIIDECSNTIFHRTGTSNQQPQILDTFGEALDKITHKQTVAFEKLWLWTKTAKSIYLSSAKADTSNLWASLFDINPEGILQKEIKDIIDELKIIIHINKTHLEILIKFTAQVDILLYPEEKFSQISETFQRVEISDNTESTRQVGTQDPTIFEAEKTSSQETGQQKGPREGADQSRWRKHGRSNQDFDEVRLKIESRLEELEQLKKLAESTSDSIETLLALKQNQASVVQAWQSIKDAEQSLHQGRAIMIFTLVTIIFLPLGFITSVFGMNSATLNSDTTSFLEMKNTIWISAISIALSLIFAFEARFRSPIRSAHGVIRTALSESLSVPSPSFYKLRSELLKAATHKSEKTSKRAKRTAKDKFKRSLEHGIRREDRVQTSRPLAPQHKKEASFIHEATRENPIHREKEEGDVILEKPLLESVEQTHMAVLSSLWIWLMGFCFPPPPGYQRIPYICGCGSALYVDVKECAPGGLDRFRKKLRLAATAVRSRLQDQGGSETGPTSPPQAHMRLSSQTAPASGYSSSRRPATRLSGIPDAEVSNSTSPARSTASSTVPKYLLLCVNRKRLTVLEHVEVGSFHNDQYMFQSILEAYRTARREHDWGLGILIPPWIVKTLRATWQKLRLSSLTILPSFLSKLNLALDGLRIYKLDSGYFVRFQLVPIRNETFPTHFRKGEFPPEIEVQEARYTYDPVPMDAEVDKIPLSHLCTPGPHLDDFWLTLSPKKLTTPLIRTPGPSSQRVLGWGIHINERLNWVTILAVLLFLLVLTGVFVLTYAMMTSDNSTAFGLGGYLVAMVTVYITFQYFSWHEME